MSPIGGKAAGDLRLVQGPAAPRDGRRVLEGSQAVAEAVASCRPEVIAAYPITPQTHIVEDLARRVAEGSLKAEYLPVESEFSAASAVLGASAAGARSYTATASQGLLLMAEVLFNISGMRLPVVMSVANRAVSAPINIWNDQQDSLSVRDAGWIQLYAEDNQEAVDLHVQAYRIAEDPRVQLPVMVCMDGFLLTHAFEPVSVPPPAQVDAYLRGYRPQNRLDPEKPVTLGMYAEDGYMEGRYLLQRAVQDSAAVIEEAQAAFLRLTGRPSGGLLETYRTEGAELVLLTLGSLAGLVKDVADELWAEGLPVGLVKLVTYRPFPAEALQRALGGASRVGVLEKGISLGAAGPVATDVAAALYDLPKAPRLGSFVVGLGGKDVTPQTIRRAVEQLLHERPWAAFLDLEEVGA